MTYSVLGIETTQVIEIDPRTGKERPFYVPKINQQTGKEERVLLPKSSRLQGTYLIGATGTGKTGSLKNLAMQDIRQGIGVCVLDPHGDLINDIVAGLSDKEVQRVILLDTLETEYQGTHYFPGLNIFQCDDPANDLLAQETYERIKHIFNLVSLANDQDRLGVRVSQGIRNSAFTFIDSFPHYGCTMLELPVLFGEKTPRANLITHLLDETIRLNYWENFFNRLPLEKQREWADMVLNKVEGYTTNRLLRPIIGQSRTTINFREVMDTGKILLIKLPGEHEEMTELLGSLVIAQILAAAFSRRDIRLAKRKQFNIYCDEFELYASDDFTRLLKECRKYGMAVTLAHQSRDFIDLKNKAASLQVANLIVLRIIRKDADEIAGNFDIRQVRTKKVLRQKTEPVYREWDEWLWDDPSAEAVYNGFDDAIEQVKQQIEEAGQKKREAIIPFLAAKHLVSLLKDCFYEVTVDVRNGLPTDKEGTFYGHIPVWIWVRIRFLPVDSGPLYWHEVEPSVRQKIRNAIPNCLTLISAESETIAASFYYWPRWREGKWAERHKKRVDYTYIKRVEWYTFTDEAAISHIEWALRFHYLPFGLTEDFTHWDTERWDGKLGDPVYSDELLRLFHAMREELIAEVHTFFTHYYHGKKLKFHPDLAPETPAQRAEEEKRKQNASYLFTREDDRPWDNTLVNPPLARVAQPAIGSRRSYPDWIHHGDWDTDIFPEAEAWEYLSSLKQRLQERIHKYRQEVAQCEQEIEQLKDQVKQLQAEQEAWKALHYKPEHHKEYVAERAVVEEKTRTSTTHTAGESSRLSVSRYGEEWLPSSSSSRSETTSIQETSLYEWVEEFDQTPDQRRDEIASEIAMLPDYVARVKIKDENDELVEYTIRTLKPEPGLRGRALEERIAQIKTMMISQNIIRPKKAVDEEIRKRQQALRQPVLKPPHKQGELPQSEVEPPITRRG